MAKCDWYIAFIMVMREKQDAISTTQPLTTAGESYHINRHTTDTNTSSIT